MKKRILKIKYPLLAQINHHLFSLMRVKKLNSHDKKVISKQKKCPPHYLPHKIPLLNKKVKNECCHIHTTKVGMSHHQYFCKRLKCQNYPKMIKSYKIHLKNKKMNSKK